MSGIIRTSNQSMVAYSLSGMCDGENRRRHIALVLRIEQVAIPAGEGSSHPLLLLGTRQVEAHRLAEREGDGVAVLNLTAVGAEFVRRVVCLVVELLAGESLGRPLSAPQDFDRSLVPPDMKRPPGEGG